MIRRFTKNAFIVLALIVLMGVSGLAIVTKIQGGNLLSVQTKSMVPVLKKGDLVSVKSVPVSQLRPGDIITFVNPNNKKQTITHRIVQLPTIKNAKMFVTKGDANPATDTPIEASAIVGRTRFSIPYLGYGADFIRQPLGLILIIYIPALGIIIGEMRRLAEYYKKQQPYTVGGRKSRLISFKTKKARNFNAAKMLPLVLILPFVLTIHAYAVLQSQAKLTGNTIKATRPTQSCGGSNNNNINVSTNTTQNGSSGDVNNSNNTNTGSSTSGNINNSSSTSINITITNC